MLLHQRLSSYRVILASQSPRRRELMQGCAIPFEVEKFDVEECYPADLAAKDVALYLSKLKSDGYPRPLAENEILITADTVVLLDGKILGKPHSKAEAKEMLAALSGAVHSVRTGVTIRMHDISHSFDAESRVHFAELSEEQIEYYVDTYLPLDKAGSYGIQEWIGYVGVERIEGSFYNVMGLPIQRLCSELERLLNSKK